MSRNHPRRTATCNQQDDAQRDGGETVSRDDAEDRTENAAEEDADAINNPVGMKVGGDHGTEERPKGRSSEALPGESQRIDGGEQDHDR